MAAAFSFRRSHAFNETRLVKYAQVFLSLFFLQIFFTFFYASRSGVGALWTI